MIEMIPALPDNCLGFIAKGRVSRRDYQEIVDPAVESALQSHEKLRILYVLGKDFEGMDLAAMKEDALLGKRFMDRFERVAVVTDEGWISHAVHALAYFVPVDVRAFPTKEEASASEWLTS